MISKMKHLLKITKLQKIQVPKCLGGEIDMILGIQFASIHPEPVFSMPNGLTVYKSKFAPVKSGEIACIGGPLDAIHSMVNNAGARKAVSYMSNLINMASNEYSPRIDFFPSYDQEFDKNIENFTDKGIPQISEYIEMMRSELEDESLDDEEYTEEYNEIIKIEEVILENYSSQKDEVLDEEMDCSDDVLDARSEGELEEENLSYEDVQEEDHSARVFIKSMEFLASQGNLAKVCPVGSCTGYALYDCSESCENAAEGVRLKELLEKIMIHPKKKM